MFFHEPNASKLAFELCVKSLDTLGLDWMDVQMVTPITESFGAKLIPQLDFIRRISVAEEQRKFPWPFEPGKIELD